MTLNRSERAATARELLANLMRSGLTPAQLRERTGLTPQRFDCAMYMYEPVNPADIWLIRDTLTAAVREVGQEPLPFSSLTDNKRAMAQAVFGYDPSRVTRQPA